MVNHDIVYNLDNLVSLPDERRRVMNAVEDAQWQDDIELEYINKCIAKGDLYAPLF